MENLESGHSADKTPSDAEVLFPEKTVCGLTIRPWTLKQAVELAPTLAEIRKVLEEEHVSLENLFSEWPRILPRLLPIAPEVIRVSAVCPKEKAEGLMLDEAAVVITTIVQQNWDYLKNSLSLGLAKYQAV